MIRIAKIGTNKLYQQQLIYTQVNPMYFAPIINKIPMVDSTLLDFSNFSRRNHNDRCVCVRGKRVSLS